MRKVLEIACFNLESAILAQAGGADRIELCENYQEGGTTPNQDLILEVRKAIQIPVHVIIRPRGGNFIYRETELSEMRESVLFCKANKIDGVVLGILNINSEINENVCLELITLAKPMSVTFHRAIDVGHDIRSELRKLMVMGCNRVLSSGGTNFAWEGATILKALQNEFGNKITIMPGGGIRSGNILSLMQTTSCHEFHSAAIINDSDKVDLNEVKHLKKILSSFS